MVLKALTYKVLDIHRTKVFSIINFLLSFNKCVCVSLLNFYLSLYFIKANLFQEDASNKDYSEQDVIGKVKWFNVKAGFGFINRLVFFFFFLNEWCHSKLFLFSKWLMTVRQSMKEHYTGIIWYKNKLYVLKIFWKWADDDF